MWFGDVEPLSLPDLDGLYEDALGPFDPGKLANHPPPAVRLLAVNYLWLDVEDLKRQAEVWLDPQKGLANDDEGRNVQKGVRSQVVEV
jgi:hypothetical protein